MTKEQRSRGQSPTQSSEAVTGFDDQSNGFSDPHRRQADQKFFEEVEHIAPDGLGPIYNAQSCRECHQTPVTGAASQVTETARGTSRRPRPVSESGDPDQSRSGDYQRPDPGE